MIEQTPKKRGRPVGYRKENPATFSTPSIRVTEEQLTAYKEDAQKKGMKFSEWARQAFDREISRDD